MCSLLGRKDDLSLVEAISEFLILFTATNIILSSWSLDVSERRSIDKENNLTIESASRTPSEHNLTLYAYRHYT